MAGVFSTRVTFLPDWAMLSAVFMPEGPAPTNRTASTRGSDTSSRPVAASPWIKLNTPRGRSTSSNSRAMNCPQAGTSFDGLNTTVLPASKAALVALVKQVALDYGPTIRANILCPGQVDTPFLWESTKAFPNPEEIVAQVVEEHLVMKRLGTPEDIANAALFLASDDASWITGSSLVIDGGRVLGG